jgi:hypothetical protein
VDKFMVRGNKGERRKRRIIIITRIAIAKQ